jgi:nucleoside-diphosphate-sugar epimerase
MFKALYDTPVVLARIFMVYGPAQSDLKKLVRNISKNYGSKRLDIEKVGIGYPTISKNFSNRKWRVFLARV